MAKENCILAAQGWPQQRYLRLKLSLPGIRSAYDIEINMKGVKLHRGRRLLLPDQVFLRCKKPRCKISKNNFFVHGSERNKG